MEPFKTIYCITSNAYPHSICRVGISSFENDSVIESTLLTIRPEPFEIDGYNRDKYNLDQEELSRGIKWPDAYQQIKDIIGESKLITHFSPYQSQILHAACDNYGIPYQPLNYRDTMQLCRACSPDFRRYGIHNVCKYLKIPLDLYNITNISEAVGKVLLHYSQSYNAVNIHQLYSSIPKLPGVYNNASSNNTFYRESIFVSDEPIYEESLEMKGKTFCFTGTLELCKRDDAFRIVTESGGYISKGITKSTDYLVVGMSEYIGKNGKRSSKIQKANELSEQGSPIEIISEESFRNMINKSSPKHED